MANKKTSIDGILYQAFYVQALNPRPGSVVAFLVLVRFPDTPLTGARRGLAEGRFRYSPSPVGLERMDAFLYQVFRDLAPLLDDHTVDAMLDDIEAWRGLIIREARRALADHMREPHPALCDEPVLTWRLQIELALSVFTDREQKVLASLYGLIDGEVYSLEEVARRFGLTRERVVRIEARLLGKLRFFD